MDFFAACLVFVWAAPLQPQTQRNFENKKIAAASFLEACLAAFEDMDRHGHLAAAAIPFAAAVVVVEVVAAADTFAGDGGVYYYWA